LIELTSCVLAKCGQHNVRERARLAVKEPNHRHRWLLRPCRERPRRSTERLGGLEVDYKLELDWRLDRKVLDALQICSVFEKPPGCL